jgi:hypothetical protein
MKLRTICFLVLACSLASCSKDDFLDGFDKDELFATPTPDELTAVVSDWQSRDLSMMIINWSRRLK